MPLRQRIQACYSYHSVSQDLNKYPLEYMLRQKRLLYHALHEMPISCMSRWALKVHRSTQIDREKPNRCISKPEERHCDCSRHERCK